MNIATTDYYANQGNALIEAAYCLNLDEMKLVLIALSKVDSQKPQPEAKGVITPEEYANLTGDHCNKYVALINAAKSTMRSLIEITINQTEKSKGKTLIRAWFSELDYCRDTHRVEFKFSDYVAPFVYDLKGDFTQVRLSQALALGSVSAIRIYTWLLRAANVANNKDRKVKVLELSKDEILKRLELSGKYNEFKFFKRDLIDRAITRINKNTDYSVTVETIKQGRTATGIKFSYIIEKKKKLTLKLPKRPQVKAGTNAEGEYLRECINTMLEYEAKAGELTQAQAKKLISFFSKLNDTHAVNDYKFKYMID